MPNRHGSDLSASEQYAYGMGGMEKDNEISSNGNSYTTYFRQYDPRIGRWLSIDPLADKFPWQSPYAGFDNNPIYYNDPSGAASESGGNDPEKTTSSIKSISKDKETGNHTIIENVLTKKVENKETFIAPSNTTEKKQITTTTNSTYTTVVGPTGKILKSSVVTTINTETQTTITRPSKEQGLVNSQYTTNEEVVSKKTTLSPTKTITKNGTENLGPLGQTAVDFRNELGTLPESGVYIFPVKDDYQKMDAYLGQHDNIDPLAPGRGIEMGKNYMIRKYLGKYDSYTNQPISDSDLQIPRLRYIYTQNLKKHEHPTDK